MGKGSGSCEIFKRQVKTLLIGQKGHKIYLPHTLCHISPFNRTWVPSQDGYGWSQQKEDITMIEWKHIPGPKDTPIANEIIRSLTIHRSPEGQITSETVAWRLKSELRNSKHRICRTYWQHQINRGRVHSGEQESFQQFLLESEWCSTAHSKSMRRLKFRQPERNDESGEGGDKGERGKGSLSAVNGKISWLRRSTMSSI